MVLDDVYVCQLAGVPNRLFVQNPDGTATDISAAAGVDWMEQTASALLVDLDNDGDQDLVIATLTALLFMANDGDGHFSLQIRQPNGEPVLSLSAVDYDNDGRLDIYGCGNEFEFFRLARPIPYHDANTGTRNHLWRSESVDKGSWKFIDVTDEVGLNENNTKYSYGASWEDFDNDGDPDLYVANDFGRNNLYRNDAGRFSDVAGSAGVEDGGFGMSASWSDFNRDGLMDVYVANMFSAAGNRVTYQRRFKDDVPPEIKVRLQHTARGNTLFENAGDGTFRDVSVEAGVTMGRWAWASVFADLNNDGWDDILVSNGMFTTSNTKDL